MILFALACFSLPLCDIGLELGNDYECSDVLLKMIFPATDEIRPRKKGVDID